MPKSEEEWNQKYQEFKLSQEYKLKNYGIDEFKEIFWVTKAAVIGPISSCAFGITMAYFWRKGYFKTPMKKFMMIFASVYLLIGAQGYYQDNYRPGQIEGQPVPPKNPYQKSLHFSLYYIYSGLAIWQTLNLLRKSPESVDSFERFIGNRLLRRHLMITSHSLFFIVLATGCFMSGTGAGRSITTFPKINDRWVISKEDFDSSTSITQNIYENRKLLHFTHRTLGVATFGLLSFQFISLLRSSLSPSTKLLFFSLVTLTCFQLFLGAHQITHNMPCRTTMLHNLNGYAILSLFLLLMHIARKPSAITIGRLLSNIKASDPSKYNSIMNTTNRLIKKEVSKLNANNCLPTK